MGRIVEPRNDYYGHDHHRYYREHAWHECVEHDEHCSSSADRHRPQGWLYDHRSIGLRERDQSSRRFSRTRRPHKQTLIERQFGGQPSGMAVSRLDLLRIDE